MNENVERYRHLWTHITVGSKSGPLPGPLCLISLRVSRYSGMIILNSRLPISGTIKVQIINYFQSLIILKRSSTHPSVQLYVLWISTKPGYLALSPRCHRSHISDFCLSALNVRVRYFIFNTPSCSSTQAMERTEGMMKMPNKIPDNLALYGNVALMCIFIYSAGDMMLSLIHISEPTRRTIPSRMPSSA